MTHPRHIRALENPRRGKTCIATGRQDLVAEYLSGPHVHASSDQIDYSDSGDTEKKGKWYTISHNRLWQLAWMHAQSAPRTLSAHKTER